MKEDSLPVTHFSLFRTKKLGLYFLFLFYCDVNRVENLFKGALALKILTKQKSHSNKLSANARTIQT